MIDDLRYLSDVIGGRTTGTDANARAVDWAVERFKEAGVSAREESFKMPQQWIEISTEVTIRGKQIEFSPRAVAKQYSKTTGAKEVSGPVLSVGFGSSEEFQRAASAVAGAWLLVDTDNVIDLAGLFGEYSQSIEVERLAAEHGALGIIYVAPRPNGLLHRLVLFSGVDLPVLYVEREEGLRIGRLLKGGHELAAHINIDAQVSGAFDSFNVVGEIPGSDLKEEIVLIGAHLDSHSLGTGAIDNGGNVSILIDVARQMVQHNIRTRRTLRFVLWNGEEQGFMGSWAYTQKHARELPQHVMAASIDVGEGPINGFYMNGRGDELREILNRTLRPVAGLGSFEHADTAVVGTDNYDFMLNGVANLVSLQDSPELGPNYPQSRIPLTK